MPVSRNSEMILMEVRGLNLRSASRTCSGSCAAGTVPVYRLYRNDRGAVDHRYTTSRAIQVQMIAAGWLAEGSGPGAVAMCAPEP